jgi:phospholipid/cholesterol/gamma-HCH transport system ATP-binding protein
MARTLILTDVGLRAENGRVVFDGVNVRLEAGELLAVAGPSGAGRSALLEICAGLLRPTSGSVAWDDQPLCALAHDRLLEARRALGYMFQTPALIANMTVFDNVALPLRYHTVTNEVTIREHVRTRLRAFGLESVAQAFPEVLSVQQARSVAFVRAFILDPELVLLDEPTLGGDHVFDSRVIDALLAIRAERPVTTMLATNSLRVVKTLGARVALLAGGRLSILGHETPSESQFETFLAGAYEQS